MRYQPLRLPKQAAKTQHSIAGLATAIICSKLFEHVIIVEPDSMTEVKRTRVAQAEQIHGRADFQHPHIRDRF